MRLECRLIELRATEGGEARGPALHGSDEALLAPDYVLGVAVPGLPGDVQRHLRLAPHCVEWIVPQQKTWDDLVHSITSERQIARLDRGASRRAHALDRGFDRLCPERDRSRRVVDLRLVGDKAVLFNEIAGKPGETIAFAVTVKDRAGYKSEKSKAECGSVADSVLHADLYCTAGDHAERVKVGEVGGGTKNREHLHCRL